MRQQEEEIEAGQKEAEIAAVCGSTLFRKAPAQRELLRYLWEHRDEALAEYRIGVEALGRKADFDPKSDSTVRVQISRLRQRLKEHYSEEGARQSWRVRIPAGEYRVEVVPAETMLLGAEEELATATGMGLATGVTAENREQPLQGRNWRRRDWLLLASGVATGWLGIENWRLRRVQPERPELPPFWARLVQPGQPLRVIVPAPIFFRWEGQPYVVRDFGVNHIDEFGGSTFLAPMEKRFGEPQVTQLYTVASDTRAAAQLANYLKERGVPAEVTDTPATTVEMLNSQSTVVFAGPGTTRQLGGLLEQMNFHVEPGRGGVLNRRPKPGEPEHYTERRHAPLRTTNYGILARLPGRAAKAKALVFLSTFNPALLAVCLHEAELAALTQFLRQEGDPEYFEAVVQFDRNADIILQTRLVTLRAIGG